MFTVKRLLFITFAVFSIFSQISAQVTIGSGIVPNTDALLDLKETSSGTSTKGLLLPRVELSSTTSSSPMSAHIMGMTVYNTATKGDVTPGYYYNNGESWVRIESAASWFISGTQKASVSSTDSIYHLGHVTIGRNSVVDKTAILDVNASNKGVLFPKVTLTSSTDIVTIPNPTVGLFVYNTGENSIFKTKGYMYWDGSSWKLFNSTSSEAAEATLNCNGASLSPAQQIMGGTAITTGTVLQIPYTVGNGGSYNGATLVSKGNPNVIAVSSGGMLNEGSGVINFSVSGTPTVDQQAPIGITFDLTPFLTVNTGLTGCSEVVVGNTLSASIEEVAVMGYLTLVTDNTGNDTGTQYYTVSCDSPDGKFSVRAGVPVTQTSIAWSNQFLNVQIRNNTTASVPIIWNHNTDYGGSLSRTGVLTIPSQRWGGDDDNSPTWYNATGNNTNNGVYWGQIGIYDGTGYGPEYRRYTWIPQGADNKVPYEAIIMVALDTTTPTVAVPPGRVKCYIKFSQVTAVN